MPSVMTVRSKKRVAVFLVAQPPLHHFGQVRSERRFLQVPSSTSSWGMMTSRQGFSVMGVSFLCRAVSGAPGQLGLKVFHGR